MRAARRWAIQLCRRGFLSLLLACTGKNPDHAVIAFVDTYSMSGSFERLNKTRALHGLVQVAGSVKVTSYCSVRPRRE